MLSLEKVTLASPSAFVASPNQRLSCSSRLFLKSRQSGTSRAATLRAGGAMMPLRDAKSKSSDRAVTPFSIKTVAIAWIVDILLP